MTVVADLEELAKALPAAEELDDRGALPARGLTALAGSAGFAVWTSLTCFVC